MYSLFSLVFNIFLWPLTWALVLLIISLIAKKPKRKRNALIGAIAVLFLFSNRYLLNSFARAWDVEAAELPTRKVFSAAIMLGGFTGENLKRQGYFNDHSDRLVEGLYLKNSGRVSHLIITGGNNRPDASNFTEAKWVKKIMLEMNYPDSTVLIDQRSTNTNENAIFTKQLLDSAHLKPPYLLVTSAFHMRRALYIFKKKGIPVIPYPCDYLAGNSSTRFFDYFVPNASVTYAWNYYLKEVVGIVVEHLKP